MKTDALIALLATHTEPMPARAKQRFALASLGGGVFSFVLMLCVFGFREDLSWSSADAMFGLKVVFATVLAVLGFVTAERLGRPGVGLGGLAYVGLAVVLCIWTLAAYVLWISEPQERVAMVIGDTWKTCTLNISILATPFWAANMWAMRGLAPTQLKLAGASAGALAGALACLIYAFHCPESAVPFVAVWYVAGIAIPTLAGAWTASRILSW